LNGDESIALGAAFHAANMSHSFKVRPIHFYDGFSFDIVIDITSLDLKPEDEGYYSKQI
jgi:hypoxia up-regulated 1